MGLENCSFGWLIFGSVGWVFFILMCWYINQQFIEKIKNDMNIK